MSREVYSTVINKLSNIFILNLTQAYTLIIATHRSQEELKGIDSSVMKVWNRSKDTVRKAKKSSVARIHNIIFTRNPFIQVASLHE